jgi:hypothetical protein
MRNNLFNRKKILIFALTLILMGVFSSQAFALPNYVNGSSTGSTNVYVLPNSSSMVVGSIGVESVKVYCRFSS